MHGVAANGMHQGNGAWKEIFRPRTSWSMEIHGPMTTCGSWEVQISSRFWCRFRQMERCFNNQLQKDLWRLDLKTIYATWKQSMQRCEWRIVFWWLNTKILCSNNDYNTQQTRGRLSEQYGFSIWPSAKVCHGIVSECTSISRNSKQGEPCRSTGPEVLLLKCLADSGVLLCSFWTTKLLHLWFCRRSNAEKCTNERSFKGHVFFSSNNLAFWLSTIRPRKNCVQCLMQKKCFSCCNLRSIAKLFQGPRQQNGHKAAQFRRDPERCAKSIKSKWKHEISNERFSMEDSCTSLLQVDNSTTSSMYPRFQWTALFGHCTPSHLQYFLFERIKSIESDKNMEIL